MRAKHDEDVAVISLLSNLNISLQSLSVFYFRHNHLIAMSIFLSDVCSTANIRRTKRVILAMTVRSVNQMQFARNVIS